MVMSTVAPNHLVVANFPEPAAGLQQAGADEAPLGRQSQPEVLPVFRLVNSRLGSS